MYHSQIWPNLANFGTLKIVFLDLGHCSQITVWKFYDFSITQTLREINFGESKRAKSAILTHLEDLNFDFGEILHQIKKNSGTLK